MSHDPPDSGEAASPERAAALLTAYVDGVAELSPEDRRRVSARLARDPEARADQAAVRALLDRLRALPAEGAEPDWTAMERSIRQAVGDELPRPWWRSWKWLAPTMMLAGAAAVLLVLLVMWARPGPVGAPEVRTVIDHTSRDLRPAEDLVALWLDGAEVDVDLSASDLLGDAEPGDSGADALASPDPDAEVHLLPWTNLAWVDQLDEGAIERAERWLARKKG